MSEKNTSKQKNISFHLKKAIIIPFKPFPPETLNNSINLLTYGVSISKPNKSYALFHNSYFYILENDNHVLQWISYLKPYNKSRIDLKTIKNITDDPQFDTKLSKKFKQNSKMLFISYIDSNKSNVLTLKFKDKITKNLFWQAIQHLALKAIESQAYFGDFRKVLAQKLFIQADKDGNKTLDYEEINKILKQLHMDINHEFLLKIFMKYDKDHNKTIDWIEFQEMIDDITLKSELEILFTHYCKDAQLLINGKGLSLARMDFQEFQEFLQKEQKQKISKQKFEQLLFLMHFSQTKNNNNIPELLNSFDASCDINPSNNLNDSFLTFSEFCTFIFSPNNDIFDPEKLETYQDMSQPLTDYYINSSHNTYLLSNQLTGESSTKAYINAFEKGCRCVELDCWNGDKGEPVIYHGYTFTSKILFRDVCQTIKDYAFVSNTYPVILSLEDHCKPLQQVRMAEILNEIFGKSLFNLPENYLEMESFPSPEALKYRVLVKNKTFLPVLSKIHNSLIVNIIDSNISENLSQTENEEDEIYLLQKKQNLNNVLMKHSWEMNSKPFLYSPTNQNRSCDITSRLKQEETYISERKTQPINRNIHSESINVSKKKKKSQDFIECKETHKKNILESSYDNSNEYKNKGNMSPSLKKLLCLFGVKINLSLPRSIWNISSLKEPVFKKIAKESEDKLQDFLRNYFIRVYPSATKVDSSNFDPIESFNFGVQMVALNIQTPDLPLLIYMSKFQENGGIGCGYLLKPEFMRKNKAKYIKDFKKISKILCINIISGQQLRPEKEEDIRDVVDPYVEVSIRGIPVDEKENSKVFKSKVVYNNGFNPRFDLQCQFKLACPENAFVIFKVFDEEIGIRDLKIGWNAVPYGCLRPGYRILPLMNSKLNTIMFSCLFCKVELKDVMLEEYEDDSISENLEVL